MEFNFQNIFLIIGLCQGIVIIGFSLLKSGSSPSKYLLSCIIAIFCVAIFNNLRFYFVVESGEITITNFLIWEPITLIGPLTFFYIRSLFEKEFKFRNSYYLHFLPVLLELFPTILAFYLLINDETKSVHFLNTYDDLIVIPQIISLTTYLLLCWKYLAKNRQLADLKTFRWSRDFVAGLSIIDGIWMPFVILYLTNQKWLIDVLFFYPVFYPIVVFLYFLGIRALTTNLSFRPNPYSSQEIDEYLNQITHALQQQKLYKQHDFSLKSLSEQVSMPIKTISFVLNHTLRKGFNEFINEYRIQEALTKINNGVANSQTLESIAYEVGFSSRPTFYRAFKQVTGKHPTTYLKTTKNFVSKKDMSSLY